jgi:hypothetical protein
LFVGLLTNFQCTFFLYTEFVICLNVTNIICREHVGFAIRFPLTSWIILLHRVNCWHFLLSP